MSTSSTRRLGLVWLALSAVTLLSWWIGSAHGQPAFRLDAAVTFGVLAIAALKVRLIVSEFMEARHAPPLLRRLADAWLIALLGTLLAIYALGSA
jgi:hypothetical protein